MKTSFSRIQKDVAKNFGIFITQPTPARCHKVSWKRSGEDIVITYADGHSETCQRQGAFYRTQMRQLQDGEEVRC